MKKLKIALCIFIVVLMISMPAFAIYIGYTIGTHKAEFNLIVGLTDTTSRTYANAPKTTNGMIPVAWSKDDSAWKVVSTENTNNEWYAYFAEEWANVMMSDGTYIDPNIATDSNLDGKDDVTGQTLATVGTIISQSDMGSMFTWIPRYEYKITNKIISVKFIEVGSENTAGYVTHPAFTNEFTDDGNDTNDFKNGGWDKELDGFWASKFQASKSNEGNVQSLPNKSAWNSIATDDAYTVALNENYGVIADIDISNLNSHLMKNSEWGAVGYLSWSNYALDGMRMYINNYMVRLTENAITTVTTKTGISGNTVDATETTNGNNTYETVNGVNASTTGNITGIYDINGCLTEYTASCLTGASLLNGGSSTKYVMAYSSASESKIGDAVLETSAWENCAHIAITTSAKYFMRGEPASAGSKVSEEKAGGQFAYNSSNGIASPFRGFRTVIIVE